MHFVLLPPFFSQTCKAGVKLLPGAFRHSDYMGSLQQFMPPDLRIEILDLFKVCP